MSHKSAAILISGTVRAGCPAALICEASTCFSLGLILVIVGGAELFTGDSFAKHTEHVKQHATKVLSHVAEAAQKAGVPCETVQLEHDQPYEAIIRTAEDKGCDLIVMASHGRSGISAVLLGSVTNKVLTHTKIPVLVCQ